MSAARDGRVHLRAAHLLQRHLLPDHHLGHARRAQVHRRVALAHDHHVAERRDVGPARGGGTEQHAYLRHPPRHAHLVVEDAPRAAAAGEHLDLIGDARAGGVDEVDHRDLVSQRLLLDPEDLLDGLRAPGARLHGRVVRHQRHAAPADQRHPGHDTVGAEAVLVPVGEQRLLGEGLRVHEPRDPVSRTGILPWSGSRSRYFSGPPASACSSASSRRPAAPGASVCSGVNRPRAGGPSARASHPSNRRSPAPTCAPGVLR